jgi:hypothetical protein
MAEEDRQTDRCDAVAELDKMFLLLQHTVNC